MELYNRQMEFRTSPGRIFRSKLDIHKSFDVQSDLEFCPLVSTDMDHKIDMSPMSASIKSPTMNGSGNFYMANMNQDTWINRTPKTNSPVPSNRSTPILMNNQLANSNRVSQLSNQLLNSSSPTFAHSALNNNNNFNSHQNMSFAMLANRVKKETQLSRY